MSNPIINVITRTSGRPKYFRLHKEYVDMQGYDNINHIVCVDDDSSRDYVSKETVDVVVDIDREQLISQDPLKDKNPFTYPDGRTTGPYSPHNLYLNEAIKHVNEGWVMYLDDDDRFIDNNSIKTIVRLIEDHDDDTLIYWRMTRRRTEIPRKAPNPPVLADIGSPCFTFNIKYKEHAEWDGWKCGDHRVVTRLHKNIPNKIWFPKSLIWINSQGLGNRKDLKS